MRKAGAAGRVDRDDRGGRALAQQQEPARARSCSGLPLPASTSSTSRRRAARSPAARSRRTWRAFVARFLARRLVYTYEIVDLVPGERLTIRTAQGPFPMETTYTFAVHGNTGPHMTLRNRGEPKGFSAISAPLMTAAMRRANRKDLAPLKVLLERTTPSPGD
ncbi:hypothetical protein [Amycolatopsis vastitatis]|uniref:hypothetical protein n=1 Tax=Amycolatopsis vastitatis TaxID=1905142 RepID=UPI001F0A68F4|nr:hypothetical protein [Amycolatopsis vastitatis]